MTEQKQSLGQMLELLKDLDDDMLPEEFDPAILVGDIKDKVDALPLSKKATPAQIILLLAVAAGIFGFGAKIAWWAADTRTQIMGAISEVGAKTEQVNSKVEVVRQSQEWLRASTMSKAEMTQWAQQLEHLNRAIEVPSVPTMVAPAAAAAASTTPGRE